MSSYSCLIQHQKSLSLIDLNWIEFISICWFSGSEISLLHCNPCCCCCAHHPADVQQLILRWKIRTPSVGASIMTRSLTLMMFYSIAMRNNEIYRHRQLLGWFIVDWLNDSWFRIVLKRKSPRSCMRLWAAVDYCYPTLNGVRPASMNEFSGWMNEYRVSTKAFNLVMNWWWNLRRRRRRRRVTVSFILNLKRRLKLICLAPLLSFTFYSSLFSIDIAAGQVE